MVTGGAIPRRLLKKETKKKKPAGGPRRTLGSQRPPTMRPAGPQSGPRRPQAEADRGKPVSCPRLPAGRRRRRAGRQGAARRTPRGPDPARPTPPPNPTRDRRRPRRATAQPGGADGAPNGEARRKRRGQVLVNDRDRKTAGVKPPASATWERCRAGPASSRSKSNAWQRSPLLRAAFGPTSVKSARHQTPEMWRLGKAPPA